MNLACFAPLLLHSLGDGIALLLCNHLHLYHCRLGDLDNDAVHAREHNHKRDDVPRGDTLTGKQCDFKRGGNARCLP